MTDKLSNLYDSVLTINGNLEYKWESTKDLLRAATLDNLFSPRAGTEIPYVSFSAFNGPATQATYSTICNNPLRSSTNIVFSLEILYICISKLLWNYYYWLSFHVTQLRNKQVP
jgi:hypothetical protein